MNSPSQGKAPVYVWDGCYSSWDEACVAAKARAADETFSNERWMGRITRLLQDYRQEFQQHGIAMPPRPSGLPLVCALETPRSIVDLGGSSGWCWDYLKNSLPGNEVASYVVVEIEEVVNYMSGSGLHKAPVSYRTLSDMHDPCDLLYCNSVMQYFPSNAPLLSLIGQTAPRSLLLEDVLAHGSEDFFTTQPYFNSAIPYRIMGLRQLLDDLSQLGYHEIFRSPYASPVNGVVKPFETGNFPEEKRFRYSLSLLLSRDGRK